MTETTIAPFDGRMGRLYDAGLSGLWLVNTFNVNLDDMLNAARPGAIVRVRDLDNSLRFIPHEGVSEVLGCIAGWVSEEED
jgi:hypothetical protein